MLILSRKSNETFTIGDAIRITVLSIKRNQVNIGIVAPRQLAVSRVEIPERDVQYKLSETRSSRTKLRLPAKEAK